jgi:hypothetical protein
VPSSLCAMLWCRSLPPDESRSTPFHEFPVSH